VRQDRHGPRHADGADDEVILKQNDQIGITRQVAGCSLTIRVPRISPTTNAPIASRSSISS
jgi:hypothetical protein